MLAKVVVNEAKNRGGKGVLNGTPSLFLRKQFIQNSENYPTTHRVEKD
jgi:hypothetical protein